MHLKFHKLIVISFLWVAMLLQTAAIAQDEPLPADKAAVAKVFFVTTRRWNGRSFTEERGDGAKHSVGTCLVHFPKNQMRWDIAKFFGDLKQIGWQEGTLQSKWQIDGIRRDDTLDGFLDTVRTTVNKSSQRELVIYVHGYHNGFDDAARDAAVLGSYFKCPVIAYTWPTPKTVAPTLKNYHIAENQVSWSQQPFTDFLKAIVATFPDHTITLVCHSMGSRLVVGGLHDLYPNGGNEVFKEVAFASADYDSDTFINRAGKSLSVSEITRIYVSPKDKAMDISSWFAGGYTRMGSPGDNINLITSLPKVQVIDFTKYGGGLTGHSMAHWLVANMHKYRRPGGEWRIQQPAFQLVKKNGIERGL